MKINLDNKQGKNLKPLYFIINLFENVWLSHLSKPREYICESKRSSHSKIHHFSTTKYISLLEYAINVQ